MLPLRRYIQANIVPRIARNVGSRIGDMLIVRRTEEFGHFPFRHPSESWDLKPHYIFA